MEILIYILIGLIGLCVGSFLNVLIFRVPNNLSIVKPNSFCSKCNNTLKWYHNIPIFSYIFLKGKCSFCKTHIPFRYTFVEILNTILWLACVLFFWNTSIILAIIYMFFCSFLLVVAFIDLEHKFIPDRFQIVLLVLGVLSLIFTSNIAILDRIIGFFVGGGVLLFFYGCGLIFFKKEALGIGDIKLMAVCGLVVGWQNILFALFVGVVVGSIVLIFAQKLQKEKGKEYPFAPFLASGVLLALFLGEQVINWYINLFA
ncbi:MAG: prepilin peptidase [Clostridia bacterium]|nr:prepilin peptidase [Clostridia bacterium]